MPESRSVVRALRNFASGMRPASAPQLPDPDWQMPDGPPPLPSGPTVSETIRSYHARLKHTQAPRILVVDDEPSVQRFVVRVLRDAGYVVMAADGGPEALHIIRGGAEFDLIVSDVKMPVLSGPEFIKQLRQERPGITVLYLTGYNEQLFKEQVALAENEAFLNKPSTVKGLLEAVSLLVCGHLVPPPPRD